MTPIVSITESVTCTSTPAEIVDAASDFDSWSDWLGVHDGWPDGPPLAIRTGTIVRQRISLRGVPAGATVRWTVTDMNDSDTIAVRGDGLLGGDGQLTIRLHTDVNGGTLVEVETHVLKTLLPRPLHRRMLRYITQEFTASVHRLDAVARARRPPGAAVAP